MTKNNPAPEVVSVEPSDPGPEPEERTSQEYPELDSQGRWKIPKENTDDEPT